VSRRGILAVLVLCRPGLATADEGFWTASHFPTERVKERYGVQVDDAVLSRAVRATVRLNRTGAFVSSRGLVVVNAAGLKDCLHALRSARKTSARFAGLCRDQAVRDAIPLLDRVYCRPLDQAAQFDYVENGYLARTAAEELRCPELSAETPIGMTDVTDRVEAGLRDVSADRRPAEEAALRRRLVAECESSPARSCTVASLHGGARYELHAGQIHSDVRLVFVPERRIMEFGEARDHLTFPDHDLNVGFVRVYEGGKPLQTPDHLRWSTRRMKEGELVLMVGHPGRTLRYAPAVQLRMDLDRVSVIVPLYAEERGVLRAIAARRPSVTPLIDWGLLDTRVLFQDGRLRGLSPELIASRVAEEGELVERLQRSRSPLLPEVKAALAATQLARGAYAANKRFTMVWTVLGTSSLVSRALSALYDGRSELLAPTTMDDEVEIARLEVALRKLQEIFAPRDPLVEKALGEETPRSRAIALVRATRLDDPSFLRQLARGGRAAAEAAKDPLIDLVRSIEAELVPARRVLAQVDAYNDRCASALAAARFALQGDEVYPEGTGTVRISFGTLASYQDDGRLIAPVTTLGDLFRLSRDHGPYQLPQRWTAARNALDLTTPLVMATTNDGADNSGVLVDRNGDFIGVMYYGNRYYPSYRETYDDTKRRMVSTHAAAVVEALRHVYRAPALLEELGVSLEQRPQRTLREGR
jgi:Peptidase S46